MTIRRRFFAAFPIALVVLFSLPAAAQTDPRGASDFVRAVIQQGLAVIEDGAASDAQRQTRLGALVERSFDVDAVSGYVLGRYRNQLAAAQLAEFRDLYLDYVMAIYFNRLSDIGRVQATLGEVQPQQNGDVIVTTGFQRATDAAPLSVGWRVRGAPGAERVLDIQTEGVSLALTQRSEFTAVLRSQGYDGLTAAMRRKIANAGTSS